LVGGFSSSSTVAGGYGLAAMMAGGGGKGEEVEVKGGEMEMTRKRRADSPSLARERKIDQVAPPRHHQNPTPPTAQGRPAESSVMCATVRCQLTVDSSVMCDDSEHMCDELC